MKEYKTIVVPNPYLHGKAIALSRTLQRTSINTVLPIIPIYFNQVLNCNIIIII